MTEVDSSRAASDPEEKKDAAMMNIDGSDAAEVEAAISNDDNEDVASASEEAARRQDADPVAAPAPAEHISKATYPLAPFLSERLHRSAVVHFQGDGGSVEVLDPSAALAQLLRNAVAALDRRYFEMTPGDERKQEWFQHNLCIRVQADRQLQQLTITDYGCGMTRADLINILGVVVSRGSTKTESGKSAPELKEDWSSTTTDTSSGDDEDDSESVAVAVAEEIEIEVETNKDEEEPTPEHAELKKGEEDDFFESLSCLSEDLGGFYAAVCALGVGVRVGTKNHFDDYYEFQIGQVRDVDSDMSEQPLLVSLYDHFVLTRPHDEGTVLSADLTGHDSFIDIRGDSGTKVTIQLSPDRLDLLDEESTLLPMLAQIMEQTTTQYSFLSASAPDAQQIIDASAIEADERKRICEAKESQSLDDLPPAEIDEGNTDGLQSSHKSVKERSKYIPLRLSLGERKMLRLVQAAMHCCDYTTQVDRSFRNPARRMHQQLKSITSILRGLVTACDFDKGQKLADDYESDNSSNPEGDDDDENRHWKECEPYIQRVFELARRHKIANPESARTEYGKLIHLLQDAVSPSVQPHLGVSVQAPIHTVYSFLEENDGLALLDDTYIEVATEEILAGRKSRETINKEIRQKEHAVKMIKSKYRSKHLSSEDIHLCLYSICDNTSFLNSNSVPIDKMIGFMKDYFSSHQVEEGYELSIVSGQDGARLSHSHERQYYFALQTMTLWRDIIEDMFRLWAMMEADMMSETVPYRLQDTGQGLQRVQQSPRTYQAMQQILVRVQQQVDQWVGSSVIHLGDHNVPNALSFIDKYTQVPRILGPIVACLEQVEKICDEDEGIREMIDEGFGGMHQLRKDIMYDFLRSAFDGSGADNFYDAGSCIDGRLTSAWNWCSQLPDKPFYPIFKLTGFIGFDGEFK